MFLFTIPQKILFTFTKWFLTSPVTFIVALIVVAIVFIGTLYVSITSGWNALFAALNPEPQVTFLDSPTVLRSVKAMGEFVSVSYQFASADTFVDIHAGPLNSCANWGKFAYVVEVQAGTDLSTLSASDVVYNDDTKSFTIIIPEPKLTICNVNDNYSRYDVFLPGGFCPKYDSDLAVLGEHQVIETQREVALQEGILQASRRENEETLSTFFQSITGQPVTILYKEDTSSPDASCYPSLPLGWSLKEENPSAPYWTRN